MANRPPPPPPPPLQPQQQPAMELQKTYDFAAALLITQKKRPEEVVNALMQQGMDRESASTVVTNLQKEVAKNGKRRALADMKTGAAVAVIGGLITFVTYKIASGGGTYVIAWGAIGVGLVQFFRGLINSARYK